MSDTYIIEAEELFQPNSAIKQELKPITPITAANSKLIELWSDGKQFYFTLVTSPGATRKYPRIQFFAERPEEIAPCAGKSAFCVDGLIYDLIVTEVIHDGHYFYVWNLESAELLDVLYGEQSAA